MSINHEKIIKNALGVRIFPLYNLPSTYYYKKWEGIDDQAEIPGEDREVADNYKNLFLGPEYKHKPTKKALKWNDLHPSVNYEYGVGYDSPRSRDIVKNPSTTYPSYYPVNYPYTPADLETERQEDFSDADTRLYPKRDDGLKYKNDEEPFKEKPHRNVENQHIKKFEGTKNLKKGKNMDSELIVKKTMNIEALKFKVLRQHLDKEDNPNAKKLLNEIESLIKKDNMQRADALISRYNRKYKKKLKLEDLTKEKVYANKL